MKKFWDQTVTFFKDVKAELKKVNWPSREGVISSTKVVILLSILLGLYVGGLDAFFQYVIHYILK